MIVRELRLLSNLVISWYHVIHGYVISVGHPANLQHKQVDTETARHMCHIKKKLLFDSKAQNKTAQQDKSQSSRPYLVSVLLPLQKEGTKFIPKFCFLCYSFEALKVIIIFTLTHSFFYL